MDVCLHIDTETDDSPSFHQVIYFALLIISMSQNSSAGQFIFSPQSKAQLKSAVNTLKLSRSTDCSDGPYGPIDKWDVFEVIDMGSIFMGATSFNGDISKWDVSRVKDMSNMFAYATKFNGDISKWDVSRVTTMSSMLKAAASFNGDISKWDVSSVSSMAGMFCWIKSFDSDVSGWDVSSVTDMNNMFASTKFNNDI